MSVAATELPDFVDEKLVTHLHRQHQWMGKNMATTHSHLAIRAAKLSQSDPKMKKLLEKCANFLDKWADQEFGRTMRDASNPISLRVPPSEAQFWREAFRCAEERLDAPECGWIYYACADYLGLM